MTRISGNIIDLHHRKIFKGSLTIEDGKIANIQAEDVAVDRYILPGFIDAHIHIESSMVVPYEFARVALGHGTVATISDPHEIANVLGMEGVKYMIKNARSTPLKFHFGAPSCVPATTFETAGAVIDSTDVAELLSWDDIHYLSEMMNYPGVLFNDEEVMKKIKAAHDIGKPVDGHAPGLKGEDAKKYIAAGISTDHECFTLEEALDKLKYGMKVIIREGSAAKNYEALHTLIKTHPDKVMFCSDDKHPDDLLVGHINELVKRSIDLGYDLFDVLRIACINPIEHYKMNVGQLRPGDPADFIVLDDTENFKVLETYVNGVCVATDGKTEFPDKEHPIVNNFNIGKKSSADFEIKSDSDEVPVITALDGELITERLDTRTLLTDGKLLPDVPNDILKISVVNRYREAPVASGFIKNFNLKEGAIASTVGHDSHNIIAVGTNDDYLAQAVNLLVENQGGLSAMNANDAKVIGLPIAGLMSDQPAEKMGNAYADIDGFVKNMGCQLRAPYMTLSFMALLVIPKIKMSDLGLFDGEKFEFIYKI